MRAEYSPARKSGHFTRFRQKVKHLRTNFVVRRIAPEFFPVSPLFQRSESVDFPENVGFLYANDLPRNILIK
jgi:hypothetical protein